MKYIYRHLVFVGRPCCNSWRVAGMHPQVLLTCLQVKSCLSNGKMYGGEWWIRSGETNRCKMKLVMLCGPCLCVCCCGKDKIATVLYVIIQKVMRHKPLIGDSYLNSGKCWAGWSHAVLLFVLRDKDEQGGWALSRVTRSVGRTCTLAGPSVLKNGGKRSSTGTLAYCIEIVSW